MKVKSELKDIRQKDIAELKKELEEKNKGLFRIHCRQVTDVVQNHADIRKLRRTIARLNTVINESQMASERSKPKENQKVGISNEKK
jgi:large subunit ribosomal protein L29